MDDEKIAREARCIRYLSILLMFFVFISLAKAEGSQTDSFKNEFDSGVWIIPARSVKGESGHIKIVENETNYTHKAEFFKKLPVEFSVGSQFIGIDKTIPTTLPARLTGVSFDAQAILPFFNINKMYLGVGVTPSFTGDSWEFDGRDFRIRSRYFAVYQPNEKWTWIGGVEILPRYKDQTLPILGVIFKPNDRLNFNLISDGPGISYRLNDRVTLFVNGDFSADEFTVDRGNSKDVILRYARTDIGGGVKLKINKFTQCSLSLGDAFNSTLKYRDNDNKVSIRSGLYYELKLEASF